MRVLVTGATGFVGRWLSRELIDAGHDVVEAPGSDQLDIADRAAVAALARTARPDAIAHLASPASRDAVTADPERAVRTQVGGAVAVIDAIQALDPPPFLLWVSSAEVYAAPNPSSAGVLSENAPVGPRHLYGQLKLAGESTASILAERAGLRMLVARPFAHVGPGQRGPSAVASFARRIASVVAGKSDELVVGNLDVTRDIADVRDVVRAYRLLLEASVDGSTGTIPGVVNVGTGREVLMRDVLGMMTRQAGVTIPPTTDPSLVRGDDPARVVCDPSRLIALTGWSPQIPLATTLNDVLREHLDR